jgi:hypothetical protein
VDATDNSHSFIVRVWLEQRAAADAPPIWRGVIEHVSSGDRRYIQSLSELTDYLNQYLPMQEANPHKEQREWWRWLRRGRGSQEDL